MRGARPGCSARTYARGDYAGPAAADVVTDWNLVAINAMPKVAFAPLFVAWLGWVVGRAAENWP